MSIVTYKDYTSWPEGERCEVLDGHIISMAPSPLPEHQDISMQLSVEFGSYLRGKMCRAFAAPIDVYVFEDSRTKWVDEDVRNWVIPDFLVVCNPDKVKRSKIVGAPDFVVEILSPASAKMDRMDKRLAYGRAGVREYWIIDPANQIVEVYLLRQHALELHDVYNREHVIPVRVLDGFTIDLRDIFPKRDE